MSYCLNPNCPQPQNDQGDQICKACGSQLLLKNRYRAISFLDSGGMSRNFLAIDTDMPEEKRCVIKQFFPAPQVLDDIAAFEKSKLLDSYANLPVGITSQSILPILTP